MKKFRCVIECYKDIEAVSEEEAIEKFMKLLPMYEGAVIAWEITESTGDEDE